MRLNPKAMMLLFGITMIGGMAVFLMLYQGSPGPLSAPHAEVIRGSTIFSCKQCHAEDGLNAGCLHCHVEIAGQVERDEGYHAYLFKIQPSDCEACHTEHLGSEFALINDTSWKDQPTNTFDHPQVDFNLIGKHDALNCDACHAKKDAPPFSLPDFPEHPRTSTMLGLNQDCISCHQDIHKSGDLTRNCQQCHSQDAFKPAPGFNHDTYFVLEGVHAKAACASCHQTDPENLTINQDLMLFGPVKGKTCTACHESPHRFEIEPIESCLACHLGTDFNWKEGQRGITPERHASYGFPLVEPHLDKACEKCHTPELTYLERFPDPGKVGYLRLPDQCRGCHTDPHGGQFVEKHPACLTCHHKTYFIPSSIGLGQHTSTYPLNGAHQAVACIQCHTVDPVNEVRTFAATPTTCKACHSDPHEGQFNKTLSEHDCTACHVQDSSTFRIETYGHREMPEFFVGKGHQTAACAKCHTPETGGAATKYRNASTTCADCHADIHRGQFRLNGVNDCARCHSSTESWKAQGFDHELHSQFSLRGGHLKLECQACHRSVPQPDGRAVIQFKPLTTRCEDCHGFDKK